MGFGMETRQINFLYRRNEDGTIDSICPLCFLTVANVRSEAELDSREKRHECDPVLRALFESVPSMSTWFREEQSTRGSEPGSR